MSGLGGGGGGGGGHCTSATGPVEGICKNTLFSDSMQFSVIIKQLKREKVAFCMS